VTTILEPAHAAGSAATVPDALLHPATGDAATLRRRELAGFLRSRRERLTPEQLGLPQVGRRRTPGLRREEVAAHAGVGVTWYTWLEQARDINVSEQVLDAISRTLLLDPHERVHLFTLAGAPVGAVGSDSMPVSDQVRQLMAKIDPYPAAVTNGRYDLLAYNRAYTVLVGDLDALPFDQRNTLWLAFTSPTMRQAIVDREPAVRRMVALYRASMAEHVGEPAWKCMVKRLQDASPEFAELWQRHDVAAPENLTKRYRHPQLGPLQFSYTNLWLSQRLGVRLIAYTPDDPDTDAALLTATDLEPRAIELSA
jgi:MmyB-like transcription regulator ligand binding domain/Helix-turn-helix domain